MDFQGFEIPFVVVARFGIWLESNGHGLPEDGQPPLKLDDFLLVKMHQCPVDGWQKLFDFVGEEHVRLDGRRKIIARKRNPHRSRRVNTILRRLRLCHLKQRLENDAGHILPERDGLDDIVPASLQPDTVTVAIHILKFKTAL